LSIRVFICYAIQFTLDRAPRKVQGALHENEFNVSQLPTQAHIPTHMKKCIMALQVLRPHLSIG
jgi:hypothetical protein